MSSPLQKIIESKRALRLELARRPVSEKLLMLDLLRERQVISAQSDPVQPHA
jgi:hypothetical protein